MSSEAKRKITIVILWTNGMVAVFDQLGEQMPEYQGEYGMVKEKILAAYGGQWKLAEWREGILASFHPLKAMGREA